MPKFKGYEVVDSYPEDGWLKGYFYVRENDSTSEEKVLTKAYRDLSYIKNKDFVLHILDVRKGDKILDVGCADGAMMLYCGLLGADVSGIDLSDAHIEKANAYLSKYGLKANAVVGDVKKMVFPENYFDKVISSDFFEHLSGSDNVLAMREIGRVLKPGGVLVLRTPNLKYLRYSKLFKQLLRVIKLKNPFTVVIPHTIGEKHQHIGLSTRKDVIKVINEAGFMNFKFYYPMNSKIAKVSYLLSEKLSESSFCRDIASEDIIAVIHKPVITSYFK